ncbi:MAG: DUF1573 domain-containing protein [Planctomycetota bacterium]
MKNGPSILRLLFLTVPVAASAAHCLHSPFAPPLNITSDRPALVFESYLADQSRIVAESRPVISEEFHFRNQGAETVRITSVEPSCGCLRPQLSSTQIAPGQRGQITLPVRTVNEPAGLREYMVNVHYEDPRPRTVSITWRVQLPEKKLLIEPRVLMILGNLANDETLPVRISDFRPGKTDTPLRITDVSAAPGLITASVGGQTVSADASDTTVNVRFSQNLPPGKHRGIVTVRTEDPDYPALQIPVIVGRPVPDMEGRLKASPEMGRVVIRGNKPEESAGTSIAVFMPADWTVDSQETFPAELLATASPPEADAEGILKTTLAISVTALPPAGVQQGLITLHFKSPDGPQMLTVPLSIVWL